MLAVLAALADRVDGLALAPGFEVSLSAVGRAELEGVDGRLPLLPADALSGVPAALGLARVALAVTCAATDRAVAVPLVTIMVAALLVASAEPCPVVAVAVGVPGGGPNISATYRPSADTPRPKADLPPAPSFMGLGFLCCLLDYLVRAFVDLDLADLRGGLLLGEFFDGRFGNQR